MTSLFRTLIASLALSAAFVAPSFASVDAPADGKDYKTLPTQQSVSVPAGKIEVTEFFWYGCPHCNEFEPHLEAWLKKQNPDVVFKRVPVAFQPQFVPHQKLYHAVVELGVEPQLTPKIFNEIHVQKDYLLTPEAQADFLAKNGVDKQKFLAAYNSFANDSMVKRDEQMIADYQIDGVPTLAVQGKYETGPGITNSLDGTLKVLDFLVAQVRAKKM
ncbi:thiol:disulfide interchange protein DsbA/DsbL [Pararobbsia silviterrae]|uniref:Thiol:disulfide interchange protein n=1 Tax=Pararobbsia silviterrae TaxID=1792498 RepID=A0A494YAI0_9BURK|nr:thiol:disulfide interchange protein DsbA/DsbL [Pararobbsia silviterrae]RKP58750.1 thiol:disulfide interchange protein DsbA/DsbL [Pararobbsia silviterrae]